MQSAIFLSHKWIFIKFLDTSSFLHAHLTALFLSHFVILADAAFSLVLVL